MSTRGTNDRTAKTEWPLLVIAAPAAVAIWSGWVGLGEMTGFGVVHPLPGIWDDLAINSAITLPIGVEAYASFATKVWLGGSHGSRTQLFARYSSLSGMALGALGQVAYHLMSAAGVTDAPWPVTTFVSVLPVAVVAAAVILVHLIRQDRKANEANERCLKAEREAAELVAEAERITAERARAEAEREANVRLAEANAEAERLRAEAANAEAERERIRAEREAARSANAPERSGRTFGANERANTAPDQRPRVRQDDADVAGVYASWLEREGTERPMTTRELAELLGVGPDAARVRANRWRKRTAGPTEANEVTS